MDRVVPPPSPRSHPWPQRSQAPRWCSVAAACVQEKLAVGAAADAEVGCRYLRPASRDESGSEPLPDPEVRPCWYRDVGSAALLVPAASAPVIMGRAQRQHVHVLEAAHHGLADLGHVGLPSRAPTFQNWRRVPSGPSQFRPAAARRSVLVLLRCGAQCCPTAAGDSVWPSCGLAKRCISVPPRCGRDSSSDSSSLLGSLSGSLSGTARRCREAPLCGSIS